jgi:hypothetical protein
MPQIGINANFLTLINSMFGSLRDHGSKISMGAFIAISFIALFIVMMVWYVKQVLLLETPDNIRRKVLAEVKNVGYIEKTVGSRNSLRTYIETLQKKGVPASHMALTNFYVSTVNATGLFFPAKDGVFSPDAARFAAMAGARAFVFDIWPDLAPGGNFGPILQVVEPGTTWRRISLNSLSFGAALASVAQTLRSAQFGGNPSLKDDPFFIYLRFRGNPRSGTFEGTASALRSFVEKYRLDPSFNACRGMDRIFRTPITELFGKVIILSNTRAAGSRLEDYINVGPTSGIKIEIPPSEIRGMTEAMKTEAKMRIQQNLTVVMHDIEDPAAEHNEWKWQDARALGAHMVAMNLWKKPSTDMFEINSFMLKPGPLRHVIDTLPPPMHPPDPRWNSGQNAGKISV